MKQENLSLEDRKYELTKEKAIKNPHGKIIGYYPVYRKIIADMIRIWVLVDGQEIAEKAHKEGWLGMCGKKVHYSNYRIPDRPDESLIGYLNFMLQAQFLMLYDIQFGYDAIPESYKEFARSNEFMEIDKEKIIFDKEHLRAIRKAHKST